MKQNILVTAAGYGGSNSLIHDICNSELNMEDFNVYGSNAHFETLAKSPVDVNFKLPKANDPEFQSELIKLINDENISLVIPNSDAEVGAISEIRDELSCKVFLPDDETVKTCHDKHSMYLALKDSHIPMAKSKDVISFDEVESYMEEIGGEQFWVRPKTGSGSKGATWVKTADQAINWMKLWIQLRGFSIEQFTISEFLPGKDYCFQSTWKDGELLVAKMCERLSYYGGEQRLSGMSSTPSVAKTLIDESALETIFKAVDILDTRPHGNFSFDLKGRADGEMCITECNIGRFCMITPIFNRTGKYNMAEIYVRAAFDMDYSIDQSIDIDEDYYLLRELDSPPKIIHKEKMKYIAKNYIPD